MDSVIQSAGGASSAGAPTRTARPVSVIGEQPSWWGNRTGRYFGGNVLHSIQIVRYKNSMSLLSNICRYIAAGVLSKCVLKKMDCCIDPVVYTRVAALQDWVRLKAPGVRDSKGCPKQIEVGEYRVIWGLQQNFTWCDSACDCDSDSMCGPQKQCVNCKCLPQGLEYYFIRTSNKIPTFV